MRRSCRSVLLALALSLAGPAMAQDKPAAEAPDQAADEDPNSWAYYRLSQEAMALHQRAQHDDAVAKGLEALEAAKREAGAEAEPVADMHYNLGHYYRITGKWAPSEAHYRAALAIYEKTRGNVHQYVADVLLKQREVLFHLDRYDESMSAMSRAVDIVEQLNAPPLKRFLYHWAAAQTYLLTPQISAAVPHALEAAKLAANLYDNNPAKLAEVYWGVGWAYFLSGAANEALVWHRRALALIEDAHGPESGQAAAQHEKLALAHHAVGQYGQAEAHFRRSLALSTEQGALSPGAMVSTLLHIAALHLELGDLEAAAAFMKRANEALEQSSFNDDTPSEAYLLHGRLLFQPRKFARAAERQRAAAAHLATVFTADHLRHVPVIVEWARTLIVLGSTDAAREQLERADKIIAKTRARASQPGYLDNHAASVWSLLAIISDDATALTLHQRSLAAQQRYHGGLINDNLATANQNLATHYVALGRWQEALEQQRLATDQRNELLSLRMDFGTDAQKLLAFANARLETDRTLSLHLLHLQDNDQAAELALETVMQRKGRVLDALAGRLEALRRHASPNDIALLDELADVRRELSTRSLAPRAKQGALAVKRVEQLRARSDELERNLSGRLALHRSGADPTVTSLDDALAPDTALVELIAFRATQPKGGWHCATSEYAAYIKRKGMPPLGVRLGPTKEIDFVVSKLRRQMADPGADPTGTARELHRRVFEPLVTAIGDARRVFVVPDGQLSLVPFGALIDSEGNYLVGQYQLSYLSSSRELLRRRSQAQARQGAVVIGAPDYGPSSSSPGGERGGALVFDPLPAAAREVDEVSTIIPGATTLTGSAATEAAVKQLAGPAMLHVATHGFFLAKPLMVATDSCQEQTVHVAANTTGKSLRGVDTVRLNLPRNATNPLLSSGLALSGANAPQPGADDGVLTALEAASIDLAGTQLVVMSACETGVGEVRSHQGVHGLRRALALAGAETQVMSLWKVDDQATRELMVGYYQNLAAGKGRVEAMREVQLAMVSSDEHNHPYYWAAFIVSGRDGPLDARALNGPDGIAPSARGCGCELAGTSSVPPWWLALGALMFARRRRHRTWEHHG